MLLHLPLQMHLNAFQCYIQVTMCVVTTRPAIILNSHEVHDIQELVPPGLAQLELNPKIMVSYVARRLEGTVEGPGGGKGPAKDDSEAREEAVNVIVSYWRRFVVSVGLLT